MPTVPKIRDVIESLEYLAPTGAAASWDNVGLMVGDANESVSKVMVALDPTCSVLAEAAERGAQLLVTHHPLIFQPLKRVDFSTSQGRALRIAVEQQVAVFAAHTNLDAAPRGTSQILAERLGLQAIKPFGDEAAGEQLKLIVFVPAGHEDKVREAMCDAGAGVIGAYRECSFQSPGTGTYRPMPGADPFAGRVGELSKAEELKLEVVVPKSRARAVLSAMKSAHPYEEVAYDLVPLANKDAAWGFGRIGTLELPVSLDQLARCVKEKLGVDTLKVAGNPSRSIAKVAVCGGAGGALISEAAGLGAEAMVTGDVKYHEARQAESRNVCVVDPGHFASEWPVVDFLAGYLTQWCKKREFMVEVLRSQRELDIFAYH